MDLELNEKSKKKLIFTIRNEDVGYFSLLCDYLYKDKEVEFAGYNIDHPLLQNITMLVQLKESSKKDVKSVLIDSIEKMNKDTDSFKKEFMKIAKLK